MRAPGVVRLRDDRGQAIVEFALVAPLLLLLIMGIVEFGRAWNAHQVITDAAREGARYVVIDNPLVTVDSARTVIENALGRAGLDPNVTGVVIDITEGVNTGDPSIVNITYPWQFRFLGPLLGWALADATIELKTSFVMRTE